MRRGDTRKLQFKFKLADNYPVDLYYLMDTSQSMADDLETIQRVGQRIAKRLSRKTKSLRMGFGTFVDKPVMPFASENEFNGMKYNPCLPIETKRNIKNVDF